MTTTINGYPIDAVVTAEHSFDSETTDHPVEKGGDVTDNTRPKPITITLDCIVSDTPIGAMATFRTIGANATTLPTVDAYQRLLAIRDARQPITITTDLGRFDNMVMQSLSVPVSAQMTPGASQGTTNKLGGMRVKAMFKQVLIVATSTAVVRVATPANAAKRNLGNKPAPAVTPTSGQNADVKSRSWSKQLSGYGQNENPFSGLF